MGTKRSNILTRVYNLKIQIQCLKKLLAQKAEVSYIGIAGIESLGRLFSDAEVKWRRQTFLVFSTGSLESGRQHIDCSGTASQGHSGEARTCTG